MDGAGTTLAERVSNPAPPRHGDGYDIGVKFGLLDRKLTGSVSWFETARANDFRQTDSDRTDAGPRNLDADPNNNVTWFEYGGKRLSRGVDLELIWQPIKAYSAVFTYGWLPTAEITENPSIALVTLPDGRRVLDPNAANLPGSRSPNAPENKFSLWNRYVFPSGSRLGGLGLGLGLSYTSDVALGNMQSDRRRADSYFLARTSLDYSFKVYGKNLRTSLTASNLFDEGFYRGSSRGEPFALTFRGTYSF